MKKISPFSGLQAIMRKMTGPLFACCFITAMLNMLFGFDTTSFAGVQSIPAFARKFGTPQQNGTYKLSGSRASFMSSVGFAGKFLGTLVCGSVHPLAWNFFVILTALNLDVPLVPGVHRP